MDLNDDDREFAAAFNDDGEAGVATADQDDAASAPAEEDGEGLGAEAVGAEGGFATEQQPGVGAHAAAVEPAQPAMTPEEIAKEVQRLKSWEGRLKAAERQRAAAPTPQVAESAEGGGEESSEALDEVAGAAKVAGSEELAAAASAAAEAVESGEVSPEDAVKQLAEDFGDEFVTMIKKIVVATAKQAVEPAVKEVGKAKEAISEEMHFSMISAKHPDYREIGASPELHKYISSLPPEQKAQAERVAQQGAAQEVIGLLDAYKAAKQQIEANKDVDPARPAQADTASIDSAAESLEGVRSGGVRLPDKPAPAEDDYAGAWNQF